MYPGKKVHRNVAIIWALPCVKTQNLSMYLIQFQDVNRHGSNVKYQYCLLVENTNTGKTIIII